MDLQINLIKLFLCTWPVFFYRKEATQESLESLFWKINCLYWSSASRMRRIPQLEFWVILPQSELTTLAATSPCTAPKEYLAQRGCSISHSSIGLGAGVAVRPVLTGNKWSLNIKSISEIKRRNSTSSRFFCSLQKLLGWSSECIIISSTGHWIRAIVKFPVSSILFFFIYCERQASPRCHGDTWL